MNGEKSMKRATIYDVASLAGVSAGTVSHVLNGTASISEQTTRRVRKAIETLGYSRNGNARALRTASTKLVGVLLNDITSEYYANCTSGILEQARAAGYSVITADAHFSSEVLKEAVSALVERCVDGLIFVGGSRDREIYEMAAAQNVPIVFGDRYVAGYPCVQFNNQETMRALVHAFYADGYRRFCYYGEDLVYQENLERRFGGFRQGVSDLGIPERDIQIILQPGMDGLKMKKAYQYFRETVKQIENNAERSIIFTSNDMIAQGVISALLHAGKRVPEDVAVFGFDNISIATYSNPGISTVVQEPFDLGKACFDLLMERMHKNTEEIENVLLRQKVVLRRSTAVDPRFVLEQGLELYKDED